MVESRDRIMESAPASIQGQFDHDATSEPALAKIFAMEGGDGAASYARTSLFQGHTFEFTRPLLQEGIDGMSLPEGTVRIGDFGCSIGKNTLSVVDFLVKGIQDKCAGRSPLEIQVFFQDLPANDFNTLFRCLQPVEQSQSENVSPRLYFAAGVPGSFYSRLFPRSSLHVAVSTFALHWLSKVPSAVQDPTSSAWNAGATGIVPGFHGRNPAATFAYAQQSQNDLLKFFNHRAAELASGGVLFFTLPGRHMDEEKNKVTSMMSCTGCDFEDAWEDLITEGATTTQTRDSFNLPMYKPNVEEIRAAIRACGAFEVKQLQVIELKSFPPSDDMLADPELYGQHYALFVKSLTNSLVVEHIGKELAQKLYKCIEMRGSEKVHITSRTETSVACIAALLLRR